VSGVFAGLVILSFYSVIAGWALEYVGKAASNSFTGASPEQIGLQFNDFLQNPSHLIATHTAFIIMTGAIVTMGVTTGLGNAVRILMPVLVVLLLVLLGYSITQGDFLAGLQFLFNPDFSKLSGTAVLVALGHAFFTLSLGMGAIMAYGSYMPEDAHIGKTVLTVALLDTAIALVAGMAIFPLVFANGLEPGSGPGLLFVTLPIAFGSMTGGAIIGTLFFVLVVIAAWSSSISLIEPGVAWLGEQGFNRKRATALLCLISWAGGMGCIYSNDWLGDKTAGLYIFESLDFLASNIMLPLGGLLIAIFVGWIMPATKVRRYLQINSDLIYNTWYIALRFIAPIGIALVFANSLGWL
jgi:NSS family neurotransmitter:Na+ symporter